jgi:hypothetical protein
MSKIQKVDFSTPAWDVPRMLRQLADSIENGELGEVRHVSAVVYQGQGDCEVYGFGPNITAGMTYMALDIGKQKLLGMGI